MNTKKIVMEAIEDDPVARGAIQQPLDKEYPSKKERENVIELKMGKSPITKEHSENGLDLSDFISLEKLDLGFYSYNRLTSLNLTNCKKLTELNCSLSNELTN